MTRIRGVVQHLKTSSITMIDFNKQPRCASCPYCLSYGENCFRCAERMEYKEDGSCKWEAEKREQCRWDALTDCDDE